MRLSRYFLPVLKENPAEAQIVSHRLMLRAGMIRQAQAGIYSWLPLGFKVLRKLENIVHEEQIRAGHIPMLMPTLQSADLWRKSGRYDAYGPEMLRITDRHDREMLFGPTNEEMITDIVANYVTSYKALPLTLYHVQWKFRDEVRPRFGVMRGREFLMKDGYNFDLTKEDALHAYNRHLVSYLRTYERMGLQAIPMRADSGPIGGDYTHEFLVLADTGESEVFYDSAITDLSFGDRKIDYDDHAQCQAVLEEFTSRYARTDETHDEAVFNEIPEERRRVARGIEVGQIFYFGTEYSEKLGAMVQGEDGQRVPLHMGSHGIGVSRLIGAIIEASHDDKGIIWPEGVTPFHCGIVNLKQGDDEADAACDKLYDALTALGLDPLYDDRNERAGGKFATMDLIGLPWRITVGPRGLKNGVVELTSRKTGESVELSPEAAVKKVAEIYAPHHPHLSREEPMAGRSFHTWL
ncbi:proline--tRNA ligase [Ruegeria pomeroyi]|uniref:proline--tRNA ligase n=1 Tax=Ruegeria pomeroyi TaxID=89184 RepID=UPI001F1A98AA|nr:proline--tRNA ligase [Ruegeria pomeroyi]MCE8510275.1 proline--tRNA ligase [Ruegeria pomeroyi]MCE8516221.1 proline--tRNA ligase [Ruegeria pomeroyi]MCE8553837.1 proline--tRNA ligase [Ruegeria pomeroyi]